MQSLVNEKEEWEAQVMQHFIEVVKTPYGNFAGIGQLAQVLSDASNLQMLKEFLSRSEQGQKALQERPRLGKVDLQQLHQLPQNTLGYCYAAHMIDNSFTPPPTAEITDEKAYLSVHLLETHDIWHVVTGCQTTKAGEIELQSFYVAQIYPSRVFLALLAKNLLKTALQDIELSEQHMDALAQGWVLGKQAKPLFGIQWNLLWETPLDELRDRFHLHRRATDIEMVAQVP